MSLYFSLITEQRFNKPARILYPLNEPSSTSNWSLLHSENVRAALSLCHRVTRNPYFFFFFLFSFSFSSDSLSSVISVSLILRNLDKTLS
uniref:Ovule protein n=1 Tax=Caenorhabditis tropicalis TaxID=1561998 RepID=A0A1I7T589_9PELO